MTLAVAPDIPVVITGPSGWIGMAFLAALNRALGSAWAGQVRLFGSAHNSLAAPDGSRLAVRPLSELEARDLDGAIVIHLAYLTKEKAAILGERQFTYTNLAIDDILLDALAGARPRALFVASSGAAALAQRGSDRHPYGMCKLRQEDRFLEWGASSGTAVLAGRIFNVAGPYINKVGSYALGSFICQAMETRTIRIDAPLPVFRSFLHVDDLAALVLMAMAKGHGKSASVDLCGSQVLEMEDVAAAVAEHFGNDIKVMRGKVDHERSSVYLGDHTQTKSLAMEFDYRFASFGKQVADTCAWLAEGNC